MAALSLHQDHVSLLILIFSEFMIYKNSFNRKIAIFIPLIIIILEKNKQLINQFNGIILVFYFLSPMSNQNVDFGGILLENKWPCSYV